MPSNGRIDGRRFGPEARLVPSGQVDHVRWPANPPEVLAHADAATLPGFNAQRF
jgi:hypothetical protein